MPAYSAKDIAEIYSKDRLVLHSITLSTDKDKRKQCFEDPASLMCGTILFRDGLNIGVGDLVVKNSVARFGDPQKVRETVLATLHDLDLIFRTHERLEKFKPEDQRGEPFVFFTNCDMGDVAKAHEGCHPGDNYIKACKHEETGPVMYHRTRGFDFRGHCEKAARDEHRDDPTKVTEGAWNELRAALADENMIGLCYLHDPQYDPKDHIQQVTEMRDAFGPDCVVGVFKLDAPGAVRGNLLLTQERPGARVTEQHQQSWQEGLRLLTFWEYVQKQEG